LAGVVAQIIWSFSQVWNGPFYIAIHFVLTVAILCAEFVAFQMVAQYWIPRRQAVNASTRIRRVGRNAMDTGISLLCLVIFAPLAYAFEEGLVHASYLNYQWYMASIELKWHNLWVVGGLLHLEMLGCTVVALILVTSLTRQGSSGFSWIYGIGALVGFVGWYAAVAGLVCWSKKLRVPVLQFTANLVLSFVLSYRCFACSKLWIQARLLGSQEEATEETEQTLGSLSTEIELI
jgi:hypothetical protein